MHAGTDDELGVSIMEESAEGVPETRSKRRLVNRPMSKRECEDRARQATELIKHEPTAREAARQALERWYQIARDNADIRLPKMQVDENLETVARLPGWIEEKGIRNGYIMYCSVLNKEFKPMILILDKNEDKPGLTYRSLHRQFRAHLNVPMAASVRICRFKPWHHYTQHPEPILEEAALPCNDKKCTALLGTSLMYWAYVHRS